MAFGKDFLKGLFSGRTLKDYTHASKTFLSNGYEFIPRNKFLFHVSFNINLSIPQLGNIFQPNDDSSTIGLMVKSAELPKFKIGVETLNQYNRKRVIQTKINYDPVRLVFHDDQGDLIRNMWYNYYSYYYKDPTQEYAGIKIGKTDAKASYTNDTYAPTRGSNDWGYIGESYSDGGNFVGDLPLATAGDGGVVSKKAKAPFFRDIRIFGMSQHKYSAYVLINPLISSWDHDTYSYAEGNGTMTNAMTIAYETVKYYSGNVVAGESPPGFAKPGSYDMQSSGLYRPGSDRSILGKGGLLDAGAGIMKDLSDGNYVGAIMTAGTTFQTFKGASGKAIIKEEAVAGLKTVLKNIENNPGAAKGKIAILIPTPARKTTTPP